MSDTIGHDNEQQKSRQTSEHVAADHVKESGFQANIETPFAYSPALLNDSRLEGRGNSSVHASVMESAQKTHGNRAVQRFMAARDTSSKPARVPVQRAFWNGNDMENDFWGTKQVLGNKWGGVADAGMSAAWNLGGVIPGFGTAEGLVGAGLDGVKSLYSSGMGAYHTATGNTEAADADMKAATRFGHDMELSAMSAIPIWGTGQGAVTGLWDAASMIDRATGGETAPLSGDIWHEGQSELGTALGM